MLLFSSQIYFMKWFLALSSIFVADSTTLVAGSSLRLSQRARPLQVAAKNWKIFYLATVYCRSQQIHSVV